MALKTNVVARLLEASIVSPTRMGEAEMGLRRRGLHIPLLVLMPTCSTPAGKGDRRAMWEISNAAFQVSDLRSPGKFNIHQY